MFLHNCSRPIHCSNGDQTVLGQGLIRNPKNTEQFEIVTIYINSCQRLSIRIITIPEFTEEKCNSYFELQQKVLPAFQLPLREFQIDPIRKIRHIQWTEFFDPNKIESRLQYFHTAQKVAFEAAHIAWKQIPPAPSLSPSLALQTPMNPQYSVTTLQFQAELEGSLFSCHLDYTNPERIIWETRQAGSLSKNALDPILSENNLRLVSEKGSISELSVKYSTNFGDRTIQIIPGGHYKIIKHSEDPTSKYWLQDPALSEHFRDGKGFSLDKIKALQFFLPRLEESYFTQLEERGSYKNLTHARFFPPKNCPPYTMHFFGFIDLSYQLILDPVEFAYCSYYNDERKITETIFLHEECYFILKGDITELSDKASEKFSDNDFCPIDDILFQNFSLQSLKTKHHWELLLSRIRQKDREHKDNLDQRDLSIFSNEKFSLQRFFQAHRRAPLDSTSYSFLDHGLLLINGQPFAHCTFRKPDESRVTIFINTKFYFVVDNKGDGNFSSEEISRKELIPGSYKKTPKWFFANVNVENVSEEHWRRFLSLEVENFLFPVEESNQQTLDLMRQIFPLNTSPRPTYTPITQIIKAAFQKQSQALEEKNPILAKKKKLAFDESSSTKSVASNSVTGREGFLRPTVASSLRFRKIKKRSTLPRSHSFSKLVRAVEENASFLRPTQSSLKKLRPPISKPLQKEKPKIVPKPPNPSPVSSQDSVKAEVEGAPKSSENIQRLFFKIGSLNHSLENRSLPPPTPTNKKLKRIPSSRSARSAPDKVDFIAARMLTAPQPKVKVQPQVTKPPKRLLTPRISTPTYRKISMNLPQTTRNSTPFDKKREDHLSRLLVKPEKIDPDRVHREKHHHCDRPLKAQFAFERDTIRYPGMAEEAIAEWNTQRSSEENLQKIQELARNKFDRKIKQKDSSKK